MSTDKTIFDNYTFTWLNRPASYSLEDKTLTICSGANQDFFQSPCGAYVKNNAPFYHTTLSDNFKLSARIRVDFDKMYDSGCLMVMADEFHWAKFCFELIDTPTVVSVVTRETSDDANACPISTPYVYYGIIRKNETISFHYSTDNIHWHLVRIFELNAPEIKVGFVAQSPMSEHVKVSFDHFHLELGDHPNLRIF